jgi:hypothetical protein
VDINPRALEFTKFNAALNSTEVNTLLGDLYTEVGENVYDLITVNPPFVPTPDRGILVHRSPGESGEEVSERLVSGLPKHLAPGGMFSMILNYPELEHETYLARLERWLGEKTGWVIAVMNLRKMSLVDYIKGHMAGDEEFQSGFFRYLDSYRSQGFVSIILGNVFILRTEPDRPNWLTKVDTVPPNRACRENLLAWLRAQLTYSAPDWEPSPSWRPEQSPFWSTVWRDQDQTRGALEAAENNWIPAPQLTAEQTELLVRLRGNLTVAELKTEWESDGYSGESFVTILKELGLMLAIS